MYQSPELRGRLGNGEVRTLVPLGILLVAARVGMILGTGFITDDAFITFRYASNLLTGYGFVFNPGESCLGTSAPLFALLLAGGGALFGIQAIPTVSLVLACVADLVTLVIIWIVLEPYAEGVRFTAAALFSLFPKLAFVSVIGMETPLVIAMMVFSFFTMRRRRTTAMLAACAVLLLLRLDTALWCGLLIATAVIQKQSFSLKGILLAIVLFTIPAWIGYAIWGSPIPFSIVAKRTVWAHLFPPFDPLRIALGMLPFHRLEDLGLTLQITIVVAVLSPLVVSGIALVRRRDSMVVFPLFALLYLFVFSFGRTVMADWYYQPVYMAFCLSLAMIPIPSWLGARVQSASGVLRILPRWGLVLGLCALVGIGIFRWREDPGRWRLEEHVRIGNWLEQNARTGESVMLEPIGYIGWRSGLRVHDIIGLVSPQVLDYRQKFPNTDRWFFWYLKDSLPTYVVLQKWELPENRLFLGHGGAIFAEEAEREWFGTRYVRKYTDARDSVENTYRFHVYALR